MPSTRASSAAARAAAATPLAAADARRAARDAALAAADVATQALDAVEQLRVAEKIRVGFARMEEWAEASAEEESSSSEDEDVAPAGRGKQPVDRHNPALADLPPRAVPCLGCVKSAAANRGSGLCQEVAYRSNRCAGCYKGSHSCVAAPAAVLPFWRRLMAAKKDQDDYMSSRLRQALRLVIELLEEENSVFAAPPVAVEERKEEEGVAGRRARAIELMTTFCNEFVQ